MRKFTRRKFIECIPLACAAAAGGALKAPWSAFATSPFPGRFQPTCESLSAYRIPEWFKVAKLGIFMHWGVYSAPAHSSEWYPRLMYLRKNSVFEWHREHLGPQSMFGYKDFIPMFRAERWRPEEWVEMFKRMGARYMVPVGEHCDGFPVYDCTFTRWCASKMGPERDIVRDLGREVRNQGLKLGVSTHRNWHYSWYTYERDFDTKNPLYSGLYGKPNVPGPLIDNLPNEVLQVAPPLDSAGLAYANLGDCRQVSARSDLARVGRPGGGIQALPHGAGHLLLQPRRAAQPGCRPHIQRRRLPGARRGAGHRAQHRNQHS
jgi:Alpha-L-fucosidase